MSWSQTGSARPGTGGKIRIKTRSDHGSLSDLETTAVSSAVGTSRAILPYVLGQLCWPRPNTKDARNARLARYFLTSASNPDMDDINRIYAKLELTMNGINSKLNVKVAPDDSAYGYVGFRGGVKGVLRGVFSPRHNLGKRNGKVVSRGDIHIDQDTLDDEDLTIITFIHEATHKYASTADHGTRGYLENTGQAFESPGLTKIEALNNADSYAWFCFAEFKNM